MMWINEVQWIYASQYYNVRQYKKWIFILIAAKDYIIIRLFAFLQIICEC